MVNAHIDSAGAVFDDIGWLRVRIFIQNNDRVNEERENFINKSVSIPKLLGDSAQPKCQVIHINAPEAKHYWNASWDVCFLVVLYNITAINGLIESCISKWALNSRFKNCENYANYSANHFQIASECVCVTALEGKCRRGCSHFRLTTFSHHNVATTSHQDEWLFQRYSPPDW